MTTDTEAYGMTTREDVHDRQLALILQALLMVHKPDTYPDRKPKR